MVPAPGIDRPPTKACVPARSRPRRRSPAALAALALLAAVIAASEALAAADETVLASRASGAAGAKGAGHSEIPSISADGRFVAFHSSAPNLHPEDTDAAHDIYVRDLETNTTTLASRADGAGGAKGDDDSFNPSISADGRFVAFQSDATNLHPDDTDDFDNVYVRDLETNTTTLASRADGADGANGNGHSSLASISADGRFVAFQSDATNLHPDDTDDFDDVYVRDLEESTTTLASLADGADGTTGNGHSGRASISADGSFVAFDSLAANLHPNDTDAFDDIYVRDLEENTTTLASRASGAAGAKGDGQSSLNPSISADGRFVVFESLAANLHPDDTDTTVLDIYVRDLEESTTALASRASGAAGAKGDGHSSLPSISADGRFVVFESLAANLHPDDADTNADVFRRELFAPSAPPPSNQFAFGKLKRNARAGTARLAIRVPGPGRIVLRKTKQLRPAAAEAGSAGQVRLTVRPRGKAKRKLDRATTLRRTVKVRVTARVTYRPSGGALRTKAKRIVLVRRG